MGMEDTGMHPSDCCIHNNFKNECGLCLPADRSMWEGDMKLKTGEPCKHPGCLSHITHPCEGCGRTNGGQEITAQCKLCEKRVSITKMLKVVSKRIELPNYICWDCVDDYTVATMNELKNNVARCGSCGEVKND